MIPVLQVPVICWECQYCNFRDTTRRPEVHSRFHPCSGMGGMTTPMVREGESASVRRVERGDYIGAEDVQVDNEGRPVMAFITEYADGHTDCAVFPGTARLRGAS